MLFFSWSDGESVVDMVKVIDTDAETDTDTRHRETDTKHSVV
jgi:hypothetical protein